MNRPDFETELLRHLRELPVEPPAPGFAARVLRQRRAAWLQPAFALALAATVVVAIGTASLLGLQEDGPKFAVEPEVVILMPGEVSSVSLMFRSERALRGVAIQLQVPEGVEFAGRPGRTELHWVADLQAGANRLDLPVIVRRGASGALVANLSVGQDRKQFAVLVKAREPVET